MGSLEINNNPVGHRSHQEFFWAYVHQRYTWDLSFAEADLASYLSGLGLLCRHLSHGGDVDGPVVWCCGHALHLRDAVQRGGRDYISDDLFVPCGSFLVSSCCGHAEVVWFGIVYPLQQNETVKWEDFFWSGDVLVFYLSQQIEVVKWEDFSGAVTFRCRRRPVG